LALDDKLIENSRKKPKKNKELLKQLGEISYENKLILEELLSKK
jgi:hypothetical protein